MCLVMQAAAPSEFDWAVCAQTLQSQQSSLSAQGAWVLVHEVAPTYHHFAILHGSPGTEILYDVLCMPASVKLYITEYAQYSSQDGQSPAGRELGSGQTASVFEARKVCFIELGFGVPTGSRQASAAPNDAMQGPHQQHWEASNKPHVALPLLRPPPSPRLATQATRDGVDQALPVLLGGR